ncbi:MAG: hypothetical protein U0939_22680 [Pirellulales bacterium]
MDQEMGTPGREFKLIAESKGKNVLNIVIIVGDLRKLLDNARAVLFFRCTGHRFRRSFRK